MRTFTATMARTLLPAMLLLLLGAPAGIAAASETNLAPGLNASLAGSHSAMTTQPNGGLRSVPPNAPGVAGDQKWDAQFTTTGLDGDVYAFAVKGKDVYVGGKFTTAGGAAANNIARWNETTKSWYPLGSGVDDEVDALAFKGNDLYVGGAFTNGLAKWNTIAHSWAPVGGGTNGPVTALAFKGNDLYIGGFFTTIGAVEYDYIAKLNVSTKIWSTLASGTTVGTNGAVRALVFKGTDLYMGGEFTTAGVYPAMYIAKWKTTNKKWEQVGSGTNGVVRALALKGSDLYVGGSFTEVGVHIAANYVAKWSTTAKKWDILKGGLDKAVRSLVFKGNDLYVGGQFTKADGADSNALAKWSTTAKAWTVFGASSPDNPVNVLLLKGSDLYVGGVFATAGGVTANHMAEYNTAHKSWAGCGNGLDNKVYALAFKGSDLYAGGEFKQMAGANVKRVARFSASSRQWFPLGIGVDGIVYALLVKGNDVYVGGAFTTAFNADGTHVPANNIAKWSTTSKTWSGLIEGAKNGADGDVYALAATGNSLYIGGKLTKLGLSDCSHVCKWNTATKRSDKLQEGVNDDVYALAVKGKYLYAGGAFTTAGNSNPAYHVAAYDPVANTWSVLGNIPGNGVDGPVFAIAFTGTYIWLGGDFHNMHTPGGDHPHDFIVATNMNPPYDDLDVGDTNGTVRAFLSVGSRMYVAGDFTKTNPGDPSEKTVNYIAWGSEAAGWQAMGSGLGATARALAAKGKDVYVGGDFTTAGGKPSLYIARWIGP